MFGVWIEGEVEFEEAGGPQSEYGAEGGDQESEAFSSSEERRRLGLVSSLLDSFLSAMLLLSLIVSCVFMEI